MLDEPSKRRETCDPRNSVAVKLADGGEWQIPKPWMQINAVFQDGRAVSVCPILTHGPELDELVQWIGHCEDNGQLLCGIASLGAYLIRRNYDLTDQDLDRLFAFRVGDPESWDWAKAILGVATGTSGSRSFPGGGA